VSKLVLVFLCLVLYFSLPIVFLDNAEEADNHFVKTLRDYDHRIGNYFEIDRGNFMNDSKGDRLITPFHEELKVLNLDLPKSETISIRAKFITRDEIQILDYHIHSNRDIYSYIGLLLILILFMIALVNNIRYKKRST